jgi:hypothetical protein
MDNVLHLDESNLNLMTWMKLSDVNGIYHVDDIIHVDEYDEFNKIVESLNVERYGLYE